MEHGEEEDPRIIAEREARARQAQDELRALEDRDLQTRRDDEKREADARELRAVEDRERREKEDLDKRDRDDKEKRDREKRDQEDREKRDQADKDKRDREDREKKDKEARDVHRDEEARDKREAAAEKKKAEKDERESQERAEFERTEAELLDRDAEPEHEPGWYEQGQQEARARANDHGDGYASAEHEIGMSAALEKSGLGNKNIPNDIAMITHRRHLPYGRDWNGGASSSGQREDDAGSNDGPNASGGPDGNDGPPRDGNPSDPSAGPQSPVVHPPNSPAYFRAQLEAEERAEQIRNAQDEHEHDHEQVKVYVPEPALVKSAGARVITALPPNSPEFFQAQLKAEQRLAAIQAAQEGSEREGGVNTRERK